MSLSFNSLLRRTSRVLKVEKPTIVKSVENKSLSQYLEVESLSRLIDTIIAAKPDKYAAIKKHHDHLRDICEKIYLSAIQKVLAKAEAEVLLKLRRNAQVSSGTTLASHKRKDSVIRADSPTTVPVKVNFDLDAFTSQFMSAMNGASEEAYTVCARGLLEDQNLEDRVTDKGIIQKFQYARANKVKNCPQGIFDEIQSQLDEGDKSGETMQEMADRVKESFGDISDNRAYAIARTESHSAYGSAQMNNLRESGYDTKLWITSSDELVRPSHVEYGGEDALPLDEEYAEGLKFPGDPDCDDPAEVCNCRCYMIKGDDDEDDDEEE